MIHGRHDDEQVRVLKSNAYLDGISGGEISGIDIEAGKNMVFKGNKFLWYVDYRVTETQGMRTRVVVIPECCEYVSIPTSMLFRNVYAVRRAMKSISLSRKMRVPLNYATLAEMSRESQGTVAAILARVAPTLEIHGRTVCLQGMSSKLDSPDFPDPIETSLVDCGYLVSRIGETGLLHRTLGNVRVSIQGDVAHIEQGDNRVGIDMHSQMHWAGHTRRRSSDWKENSNGTRVSTGSS